MPINSAVEFGVWTLGETGEGERRTWGNSKMTGIGVQCGRRGPHAGSLVSYAGDERHHSSTGF